MSDANISPSQARPIPGARRDSFDQDVAKSVGDISRSSFESARSSMDGGDQMKAKDKSFGKLFQRRAKIWGQNMDTDPYTSWYSA